VIRISALVPAFGAETQVQVWAKEVEKQKRLDRKKNTDFIIPCFELQI
jgi:hypothetical protein